MPILFVSGYVWPLALISEPSVLASQVIPPVPAIMGMLELNQLGAGWLAVMPKWLQLWGLFAVFVTMPLWQLCVNSKILRLQHKYLQHLHHTKSAP
jgi:ABC-2 type transport system permease protein